MLGRHPTAADLLAFDQGRNCWRVVTASRAAVIVDAEDYFIHLRTAMLAARERILMIGWDFDTRIPLIREPIAPDCPPGIGPSRGGSASPAACVGAADGQRGRNLCPRQADDRGRSDPAGWFCKSEQPFAGPRQRMRFKPAGRRPKRSHRSGPFSASRRVAGRTLWAQPGACRSASCGGGGYGGYRCQR